MKPIRLAMQAFCSYAHTPPIEFDRLGGRGLYLITGNTGAGKTTLFDAICFALYGVASGEARRDAGLLRHMGAAPGDETFVEFEFEHLGQRYIVWRSPAYLRPKKRGEGMALEETRARLTLPGGRVIEKPTAVNEEIERILGLTREHFSRIAMIAQGDFAKLLLSKVEERRVILQSIFGTRYFERVQEVLQRRAKALEEDWRAARRAIAEGCGRLKLPPERDGAEFAAFASEGAAARFEDWRSLALALVRADEAARDKAALLRAKARREAERLLLERAEAERVNEDFKKREAALKALERLQLEEARIEGLRSAAGLAERAAGIDGDAIAHAEAAAALAGFLRRLEEASRKLAALEAMRPDRERALSEIDAHGDAAMEAQRRAGAVRELLPRYRELAELDRRIGESGRARDGAARERGAASKEEARLIGLKDAAIAERDALAGVGEALGAVKAEAESARKRLNALERLEKELKAYAKGEAELTRAQAEAEAALGEANRLDAEHRRLYTAFQLGQAGLMASSLADGAPCPVCGATEHPRKAALPLETPTQARVEAAESAARRAGKKAEGAVKAAAVLQAERGKEWERLSADWAKCHEDQPDDSPELDARAVSGAVLAQRQRAGELKGRQAALDAQAIRLRELNGLIPQYEAGIGGARDRALEAMKREGEGNAALENLAGKREEMARTLPAPTQEEAETLAAQLQKTYDEWKARRDGAEAALKECADGIVSAGGAVGELEAQRQDFEGKERARCEAFLRALERSGFAGEADYRLARRTPEELAGLRGEIDAYDEARRTEKQEAERLREALEGKAPADLEALQNAQAEIAARIEALDGERGRLSLRIDSNAGLIEALSEKAEAYAKLSGEYAMVKSLSDTACGRSVRDEGGRQSFELFVLSELFDEVILFANQRFCEMTGGQYELIREESYRNKKSSFGLDLNVRDFFTDTVRPVHTLSGGESFMASLSLALGFADAISARAGGITLDSMFVDEGFGTLDETALDQVMGALGKLAQGDKLIALISHVPEMKRRIGRQIVVRKDRRGGSRAEIALE